MDSFRHLFERIFQLVLDDRRLTEQELEQSAPRITNDDQIADRMRRELIRRAPSTLRETRRETRGFEKA